MLPVIADPESLSSPGGSRASDSQFDVLADRRRRAVLRYLADTDGSASLSALADHLVAGPEAGADDGGALASAGDALFGTRRRVQISLRHSHVPKLADAGAVEFDHDANTVTLYERGVKLLERAGAVDEDGENGGRSQRVEAETELETTP
ncbi:DUF7344 domain-containing protein [Natronolimnohabitans innermongolicus]|uniref:DUF7344 domain-containing protein n=1 Tax=Natronolimnohabitans innermongolicus JCM 12255 TaxID=1227499 RepID=L9WI66_9EURY|nr:hypothetical protein [Natronolimnohabitans innermongolicus]ELY49205.1 hypothetical protein C493_20952 [Natronolimnohabitans innermongolicus JCM 12255]